MDPLAWYIVAALSLLVTPWSPRNALGPQSGDGHSHPAPEKPHVAPEDPIAVTGRLNYSKALSKHTECPLSCPAPPRALSLPSPSISEMT